MAYQPSIGNYLHRGHPTNSQRRWDKILLLRNNHMTNMHTIAIRLYKVCIIIVLGKYDRIKHREVMVGHA